MWIHTWQKCSFGPEKKKKTWQQNSGGALTSGSIHILQLCRYVHHYVLLKTYLILVLVYKCNFLWQGSVIPNSVGHVIRKNLSFKHSILLIKKAITLLCNLLNSIICYITHYFTFVTVLNISSTDAWSPMFSVKLHCSHNLQLWSLCTKLARTTANWDQPSIKQPVRR